MRKRDIKPGLTFLLLLLTLIACSRKVLQHTLSRTAEATELGSVNPILKRFEFNPGCRVQLNIPANSSPVVLTEVQGLVDQGAWKDISKLELYLTSKDEKMEKGQLVASISPSGKGFTLSVQITIEPGIHYLWLNVQLKESANMDDSYLLKINKLRDAKGNTINIIQKQLTGHPVGLALRKAMDDQVKSYRIPGIVTTDRGTLISVYDIRYDGSKDLPANIDVGMNRSTDGGRSWSAMKAILDMGGPLENSGVGDPAILFDPVSKTIWVAALWSKGNRSIAGSGPGLTPDETGQIVVSSSIDDGLTWSKPYSITPQVKNPAWRLFFQGPGSGIAMADGKIVFAAQYWDADKVPHSTLFYSEDHGKSWKSGLGAKSNTTESQLVETIPGTLMINMRDNRGKFRSVATTKDMGQTWTEHATSYNTLPDPVCMGSFIKAKVNVRGKLKDVLFFSNPNVSESPRRNISIKASLDAGESWQPSNVLLLDERQCDGYSALTKIDDHTIGILYEGLNRLQFLRIPVDQIIK